MNTCPVAFEKAWVTDLDSTVKPSLWENQKRRSKGDNKTSQAGTALCGSHLPDREAAFRVGRRSTNR
jgi:hypothetical protein